MGDFKMDPHFIDELKRGTSMKDALQEVADDVKDNVQEIAKAEAYDQGDYHDGIEAIAGPHENGEMAARVIGKDFKTGWIEFGTERQSPRAPLRRGLEKRVGAENVTEGGKR